MTEREKTLTELGQMDEAAYRKWVAKKYGGKPTKEEMAEWLEWRREAVACLPEAKRVWAAEPERLRVAERKRLRVARIQALISWPWRETVGLFFFLIFAVLFAWISMRSVDDVTIPDVPLGSPQEIARSPRQQGSLDSSLLGYEVMRHVVDECDFYL